jgi:hypothetical protein
LIYAGEVSGYPVWTDTGLPMNVNTIGLTFNGARWYLSKFGATVIDLKSWRADVGYEVSPDLAVNWAAVSPATGTPTVTAADATAQMIIDAINDTAASAALVTAENTTDSDGTAAAPTVAATNLSGGSSAWEVYAPAYGSAFNLPADCLRVIKLDGPDIDIPRNRWELQGRYLLLEEELAEAPVIHYVTNNPPVDEWPTTFTDAVAFLLASRMAPKLSQDQALANDFLQKHEMALGKARSKDARETRSNENFGPRQLAARSGLVRARYGNSHPPY